MQQLIASYKLLHVHIILKETFAKYSVSYLPHPFFIIIYSSRLTKNSVS